MKAICVFTGSNEGRHVSYATAAADLGAALAVAGIELVYGGARVGLMGRLADACLAAGGVVTGVMPQALVEKEIAHVGLTRQHVVHSMHERKAMMADLSDGFIALPGGAGTLDELFEIWTWAQLGFHRKPVGLLNVAGYYDLLLQFLKNVAAERFIKDEHLEMLQVADEPGRLLNLFTDYRPPVVSKWIARPQI